MQQCLGDWRIQFQSWDEIPQLYRFIYTQSLHILRPPGYPWHLQRPLMTDQHVRNITTDSDHQSIGGDLSPHRSRSRWLWCGQSYPELPSESSLPATAALPPLARDHVTSIDQSQDSIQVTWPSWTNEGLAWPCHHVTSWKVEMWIVMQMSWLRVRTLDGWAFSNNILWFYFSMLD